MELQTYSIELHTKRECAELLGMRLEQLYNYFTRIKIRPKKFEVINGVRTGLFYFPEIRFLVEQRKQATAEAKKKVGLKMYGVLKQKRETGEIKKREVIDRLKIPLLDRIQAMRKNGLSVGKIAKIEKLPIDYVWQIVQRFES